MGNRLLKSSAWNCSSGKGGRCGCRGGARGRTYEYGDSRSSKAVRLAAGPAEGVPGRIGPVNPDDDPCLDRIVGAVVQMVSVLRTLIHSVVVPHDHEWVWPAEKGGAGLDWFRRSSSSPWRCVSAVTAAPSASASSGGI